MVPDSYLKRKQPRYLRQPGTFRPVRIQTIGSPYGRHVLVTLQPGESFYKSIVDQLRQVKIYDASMTVLGGSFEQLQYCVVIQDPNVKSVISYGQPRDAGKSYMIFGNATLGRSIEGQPLVHCHAAVRTESGDVMGGHVLTETAIVGSRPATILVTSLEGIELRQSLDEETAMPLFQPVEAGKNE
jgi:predicted DNA-binding protein with PD1-like motif